jgi:clorobiocin biosynthesis protein CloN4
MLARLVADVALSRPEALAVHGPDGNLSYGELDALSGGFATALAELGVSRGDRVLVHAERSARTVAALQGVLRLGAAYVPVDAAAPPERVRTVARDCAARALCVDRHWAMNAPAGAPVLTLDDVAPASDRTVADVDESDIAYVLYTSGSTGTPKGVCLSHANAHAFVDWAVRELAARPEDRFANHASLSFDLSVLDLYAAFASGASVHIVPEADTSAPARLTQFLHDAGITVWYSVPSALMLMMRHGGLLERPAPANLRAVLFAGEPFPVPYVRRLRAWTGARLLNLYGPTETNVCAFHEVEPKDLERDRPVPIGRASCGDRLEVVTSDGRPARPGDEGELIVHGPTVMHGYWGRQRQTGPYSTGDFVRVLDDGVLDYLGRRDHMVKLRGYRVELGEVESTLLGHADIDEAAVLVQGQAVESRLVAVVAPADGRRPPGTIAVKRHCARTLPPYMVVDSVVAVDKLPRTPNGKVDRARLERLAAMPAGAHAASPGGVL